jgi:hypothetical protein
MRSFAAPVSNLRDLAQHQGRAEQTGNGLAHLVMAHCPDTYQGEHLDKSGTEVRSIRTGDWGSWPLSSAALAYAALDVLMPLAVLLHLDCSVECGPKALNECLNRMPRADVAVDPDRLLCPSDTTVGVPDAPKARNTKKRKVDSDAASAAPAAADVHSDFFRMQRNRSTLPPNAGKKKHPQGGSDALAGVCVIVSGVLDSMTREEFSEYVTRHGGRTSKSVTRKVTHLVTDHGEAGPSKLKKCSAFGVKVVGEDTILEIVANHASQK